MDASDVMLRRFAQHMVYLEQLAAEEPNRAREILEMREDVQTRRSALMRQLWLEEQRARETLVKH